MNPKVDDGALLPTLSEEDLASTLQMSPANLANLAQTVEQRPLLTIEPTRLHATTAGRRALEGLGADRTDGSIAGGLDIGATIGEGGMGIVRAATQRSLGRKVAVKTLRSAKTDEAMLRLLREAWVTGSLEHPNIVPIYDLGLDRDGTPVIVLKHIDGMSWSDLIGDAAAVKRQFAAADLLEYNLRILVQLCNAVSLAHSRGVVHRDLKPENVMVGRFGEVYLVDWGIAVSLRDDPTGRLPRASEADEVAGTPAYMAPEMLGGMGKLGERTDVYLLGAILHEILVGRPPHAGDGFRQIAASILLSRFEFPAQIPPELAAIASRAMSRAPDERFASADELRQRLEWYLRHRGSLALSAEAALSVDAMRETLRTMDGLIPGDRTRVRDRVHYLFAEARFGFRQAIRACDDNDDARTGLRAATEMVVVFELDEGHPEVAAATLAELEHPPPDLAQRVASALSALDAERLHVAALETLSADLDPAIGRRTRMTVTVATGLVWTSGLEVFGWLFRRYPNYPHWVNYAVTTGFVVAAAIACSWGWDSLRKTAVNRRTMAVAMLMFAMVLTLQLGAHLLDLSRSVVFGLHLYCWFFSATAFALLVDRRFWPSSAVFFVAFVTACAAPTHVWHAMSLSTLALTINFGIAWVLPRADTDVMLKRLRRHRTGR